MYTFSNQALAAPRIYCEADRYAIQVRYVGELDWFDSSSYSDYFDAIYAAEVVRDLNNVAQGVVYRSVLVSVAEGAERG